MNLEEKIENMMKEMYRENPKICKDIIFEMVINCMTLFINHLEEKIKNISDVNKDYMNFKEIIPPDLPFDPDDKIFYLTDDEGNHTGITYSYNDSIQKIKNISGVNDEFLS